MEAMNTALYSLMEVNFATYLEIKKQAEKIPITLNNVFVKPITFLKVTAAKNLINTRLKPLFSYITLEQRAVKNTRP